MSNICLIKLTDASLTVAKEEEQRKQPPPKGRKYEEENERFSLHYNYSSYVPGGECAFWLDQTSLVNLCIAGRCSDLSPCFVEALPHFHTNEERSQHSGICVLMRQCG